MKQPLTATLLLAVAVGSSLASCSKPDKPALAITHVTVIDATGSPPQPDMTLLIADQKITAIGPAKSIAIPPGAQILEASGKFLIPGLADMHVHLTGAGEPRGSREFILPLLIANGITTVRDMGGYLDSLSPLRHEIEQGKRLGPQIVFAGPYLDGDPPYFQPSIVVKSAGEAIDAVDQLIKKEVDVIKVQSRLNRDAYFAIASESRKRHIPFVGHVPDQISALEATQAGQASIEHLTGVLLACSSREDDLRRREGVPGPPHESHEEALARERSWRRELLDSYSPAKAESLFRAFVANGTWQVPTFPILIHLGFITPETDLSQDPRMRFVPHTVQKTWFQGVHGQLVFRSQADFALREEIVNRMLAIVGKMNSAGVRIIAGTDIPAPNVFPGSSLHEDLAAFVKAGLSPMQALQTATRNPAEFLGRLPAQGTIERDKFADLVLLDANPLAEIHNTQKIRAVIVRGKLLDRSALDELLSLAAKFATLN